MRNFTIRYKTLEHEILANNAYEAILEFSDRVKRDRPKHWEDLNNPQLQDSSTLGFITIDGESFSVVGVNSKGRIIYRR